jgi:hypothetical protein
MAAVAIVLHVTLLRRFRAAIVIATLWSVAWGVVTMLFFWFLRNSMTTHQRERMHEAIGVMGSLGLGTFLLGAALGFITGILFAVLLTLMERGRGEASWSYWRFALWGGFAALGMSIAAVSVTGLPVPTFLHVVLALCGMETAVHTAFVVRRAPALAAERSHELLDEVSG